MIPWTDKLWGVLNNKHLNQDLYLFLLLPITKDIPNTFWESAEAQNLLANDNFDFQTESIVIAAISCQTTPTEIHLRFFLVLGHKRSKNSHLHHLVITHQIFKDKSPIATLYNNTLISTGICFSNISSKGDELCLNL